MGCDGGDGWRDYCYVEGGDEDAEAEGGYYYGGAKLGRWGGIGLCFGTYTGGLRFLSWRRGYV
jgi:hypothetical protein